VVSKPLSVFEEPWRRRHRQWTHGMHRVALILVAALA
jgi:hypothetical protein